MTAPAPEDKQKEEFARDVSAGLSRPQKELPSRYLYDELGSALFEAITFVPEYGLTRADERLLQQLSPELRGRLPGPVIVAELGSGSGKKTRWVLEAFADHTPLAYFPIDVSQAALVRCSRELNGLARITGVEGSYLPGLREAASHRRPGQTLLTLFLGSTIGNFDRRGALVFLKELRSCLRRGDALLLGADLEKPKERMLLAYDDPAGVTAAFNRNVLARVNRELGADFQLAHFRHEARYDERLRRIEMHLRSERAQSVHIPAAGITVRFREGETIWTEASHKFQIEELRRMAGEAAFVSEIEWVDQDWPFAECLWIAA